MMYGIGSISYLVMPGGRGGCQNICRLERTNNSESSK